MRSRVVVLIAAWLSIVGGVAPSYADVQPLPKEAPPTAARRSTGVAVGESFTVEPPSARYMRDLDARERREQGRDWAVLATVARLGVTPEQLAAATYELPPARLPYLDELYAFEYGRGRRAYVDDRVLLFRDHDDPDPQATIGRLADRVRMENGDDFSKVEIRNGCLARRTRSDPRWQMASVGWPRTRAMTCACSSNKQPRFCARSQIPRDGRNVDVARRSSSADRRRSIRGARRSAEI
ncbi:MAG: hypothetical protein H7138_00845 [Myxococcales bacterium]|nr:hypothetical protein [Myxococcales bacterium]